MSFIYRASSTAFRVARVAPRATFSTSVRTQKTAIDTAKDALKDVDRTIANAAVKGIEKGGKFRSCLCSISTCVQRPVKAFRCCPSLAPANHSTYFEQLANTNVITEQATAAVKETVGMNASKADGSAQEVMGEMKGQVQNMAGKAQGKTSEMSGGSSEMMGEAKGKAHEVAGKAQGKTSEMGGSASEMMGEAKGKASEMAGQAKGKAEEVKAKM